jgi:hypothetical protein
MLSRNTENFYSVFLFISIVLVNQNSITHPLSHKASGFKIVKDGIVQKICLNKEPHGVFCLNNGHLGSHSNISMIQEMCQPCVISGMPKQMVSSAGCANTRNGSGSISHTGVTFLVIPSH